MKRRPLRWVHNTVTVNVYLYRYVDDFERAYIEANSCVRSLSGTTYYAVAPPSLYFTRDDVRTLLAVPTEKSYRFGPILPAQAPEMNALPVRTVPAVRLPDGSWAAGGGTECATSEPCWLQGFTVLRD
jgi:hypothetical protein